MKISDLDMELISRQIIYGERHLSTETRKTRNTIFIGKIWHYDTNIFITLHATLLNYRKQLTAITSNNIAFSRWVDSL